MELKKLEKISEVEWLIPKHGDMNVNARIIANKRLVEEMDDMVYTQIVNVASLPGIVGEALVLPDAHWGYGFPIGAVAAFDPNEGGVVTVGGVGFDINCGVRTMTTNLTYKDVKEKIKELVDKLFVRVPSGLGSKGEIYLSNKEAKEVMVKGARWVIERGYGIPEDLEYIENGGVIEGADPEAVSPRAIERERDQMGTLGSGNHYLEVQIVEEVYDEAVAKVFGLFKDQVVITFHCGSRGFGHQIGTDYLKTLSEASRKYGIKIREKELVAAPINSQEGRRYISAVKCGINFAFANRQVIAHLIRQTVQEVFGKEVVVKTLYDIGHNTLKEEEHIVDGKLKKLIVHRKGSTRGFGPGRKEIPEAYRNVGQPIIVGGSMGTPTYILVGTSLAMKKTFGSTVHGAGRTMSRNQATKSWRGEQIVEDLMKKGIYVRAKSLSGVAEEAPQAYKNIDEVIESITMSGVSKKVAKLKPIGNIKG